MCYHTQENKNYNNKCICDHMEAPQKLTLKTSDGWMEHIFSECVIIYRKITYYDKCICDPTQQAYRRPLSMIPYVWVQIEGMRAYVIRVSGLRTKAHKIHFIPETFHLKNHNGSANRELQTHNHVDLSTRENDHVIRYNIHLLNPSYF